MFKMNADHIRTIVGIVGNVVSFGLFASPIPTFWGIVKKKSVEEFQPYPYLATVMNCCMWIFYGLPIVHPDSFLVVTINGIGLLMELIYLGIFLTYGPKMRKRVCLGFAIIIVAMAGICTLTLEVEHTHESRSSLVGGICVVFGIIMYSSPLLIMKKVIKTRSVEFMPLFLSLTSCANGVIWTAYALLKFDLFILIANATGAVVGLLQLFLYGCYHNTEESKVARKAKIPKSTKDQDYN